jgi:hypothetical protein
MKLITLGPPHGMGRHVIAVAPHDLTMVRKVRDTGRILKHTGGIDDVYRATTSSPTFTTSLSSASNLEYSPSTIAFLSSLSSER